MAFSANGGGYGSRRNRGGQSLSEINVTPFVDVVLVLLIIFMLTARAMDYGLKIEVPKVRQVSTAVEDLPIISIPKDGTTYLGDKPVNINELKTEIPKRFGPASKSVYIKADRETTYEILAQVIAQLSADGFQSRLVTQPMDSPKGRK